MERSARRGRGAAWATGFWLLFLFVSLLALALVPMWLERDVRSARNLIREVLEPAERLATRIQFTQARQMEAFYSFLLVGDPDSRLRYRVARTEEEAAFDTLRAITRAITEGFDTLPGLTEEIAADLGERMANLGPLSISWHINHEAMLSLEVTPGETLPVLSIEGFRGMLATEQATYAELISVTADLKEVFAREMEVGESVVARRRTLQTEYTQILVVLGLVATVVVLVLAFRLRTLIRESESRRLEALWARREADGLLRATGDGVLGMDPDGRCTFLNRAGAELLGYPARRVVGRDVHSMLHHSYSDGQPLAREECPIIQALDNRESLSGRNETLWRAGREPFPVQISLRPMVDGSEFRGAVLSFVDMTEIRAAEASLRQAVQARDEVLAVVSHDLRNPVGTIVSAASLLLNLDPTPEKRREHLLAVKRSAERINRLIRDLLDVARLEVGTLPVHPGPFHAERLLHEVLEAHRPRAEGREINLMANVPTRVPRAWGDRHRVIQALTNLVENALRETAPGGEITLGLQPAPDGAGIHFFVSDTGPGISPENQERLFDRFWQVSRKSRTGAGLGLSIVKGVVEAHGGVVWVESEVGKGSTFWFSLPDGPDEEG
jgi:PAS domain S-box-containing protein